MYLDFAADAAAFGGFVRLEGQSCWAAVVGMGEYPLIALRDDELPRHRGLDVRTDGLWVSLTCETPGEHWSAGMEAFAVGYEDPAGALGDERGDIVALGLDLEWERVEGLWRVHGEVLVGDARVQLDTYGTVADDIPVDEPDVDADRVSVRWRAPVKAEPGPAVVFELCAVSDPAAATRTGEARSAWWRRR